MADKVIIMFAVKRDSLYPVSCEILTGYIFAQTKNSWDFMLTGNRAGQHKHLHKGKWVLFGSLLGAKAHLCSLIERDRNELLHQADAMQKRIDELKQVGV